MVAAAKVAAVTATAPAVGFRRSGRASAGALATAARAATVAIVKMILLIRYPFLQSSRDETVGHGSNCHPCCESYEIVAVIYVRGITHARSNAGAAIVPRRYFNPSSL